MPVEANTLYPLLRRLEGQGLFAEQLGKPEAQSRESITAGRRWAMRCSPALTRHWKRTAESVDDLLEDDDDAPGHD